MTLLVHFIFACPGDKNLSRGQNSVVLLCPGQNKILFLLFVINGKKRGGGDSEGDDEVDKGDSAGRGYEDDGDERRWRRLAVRPANQSRFAGRKVHEKGPCKSLDSLNLES
jgi:hypothetical protein